MNIEISKVDMSSAAEVGTMESQKGGSNYYGSSSRHGPVFLKAIELILAAICIGLIDDPANNSRVRIFLSARTIALAYATFGGFIIICGSYILGKVFKDTIPWKITSVINFVGLCLFLASGACILRDWSDIKTRGYWPPNTTRYTQLMMDLIVTCGSLSIVTAAIFILDLLVNVRLGARGEIE
uniref:CSON014593 protein n=1 Tax=Culicoides sonorensis TaxID=179676 RepID=A0A336KQR7_CULSO